MKIVDDERHIIEVEDFEPCPLCGEVDNLRITARGGYESLCKKNGSSLVTMECTRCKLELNQFDIPNNGYELGIHLLIAKWNARNYKKVRRNEV